MATHPKQYRDAHDITRTLLGAPLGGLLDETFRLMEVAEEEIAQAKGRSPEHAEKLHGGFAVLCPSEPLRGIGENLYRAHCRELLDRVREGHDTRAATGAEVVAVLSALSLQAPLDRPATFLYWQLFSALFPTESTALRAKVGSVAAYSYDKT